VVVASRSGQRVDSGVLAVERTAVALTGVVVLVRSRLKDVLGEESGMKA